MEIIKKQGYNSKKPRVIIILPRNLYPLVSGYSLKNYNLIKILSEVYSIILFVICKGEIVQEEREFYEKYTIETQICHISVTERIKGGICALRNGQPFQVGLYFSNELLQTIEKKFNQRCELLICELIRTMPYAVGADSSEKVVFDMVDSIGLNYQKSAGKTKSLFFRIYYAFEARRLLKYEKYCIEKANVTFLFNSSEQQYWAKWGNVVCLPHGVKEELLHYQFSGENLEVKGAYVSFIGKMNYRPNIDAVLWYVENVHARLRTPPALVITGAYPTPQILKLQQQYSNIIVTGLVEDPYRYLAGAVAVIAPMQTGGGIQNKVLEAMAMGKLCLLSSIAAEPIYGARDGEHFVICDTAEEYENCYKRISNDSVYRDTIGENARNLICERYTWEQYGAQYIAHLQQIQTKR